MANLIRAVAAERTNVGVGVNLFAPSDFHTVSDYKSGGWPFWPFCVPGPDFELVNDRT